MKKMLLMGVMVGAISISAMGKTLVTSFGQSADAAMLNVLFKKAKVDYEFNALAMPDSVGNYTTIAIAAGASSKGMGAAGINPLDELKRAEEFVKMAKEKNIPIIAFHLGGAGRRGKLSDDYVKVAAENATKMVVVKGGNGDGLFTDIAKTNGSELVEVKNIVGAIVPIKSIAK